VFWSKSCSCSSNFLLYIEVLVLVILASYALDMLGPDPSSVESFAKFQFDWFFTVASNEIINHFFVM